MVDYLNELRENCLEAYTGIVQGLKGENGSQCKLRISPLVLTYNPCLCRFTSANIYWICLGERKLDHPLCGHCFVWQCVCESELLFFYIGSKSPSNVFYSCSTCVMLQVGYVLALVSVVWSYVCDNLDPGILSGKSPHFVTCFLTVKLVIDSDYFCLQHKLVYWCPMHRMW